MAVVGKSKSSIKNNKKGGSLFSKCMSLKDGQEYTAEVRSLTEKGDNLFLVVKPYKKLPNGKRSYYSSATALLETSYEEGSITESFLDVLGEEEELSDYKGKELIVEVAINKSGGRIFNNVVSIRALEEETPRSSRRPTASRPEPEEEEEEDEMDEDGIDEEEFEDEEDLYSDDEE